MSLKEKAYNKIKSNILNGYIKPRQELNESSIAKKFNMSRTPIREAFLKLESEGIIEIFPHKGAIVTKLDLNDIIQISEVRLALEGLASRLSCSRINEDKLLAIKEDFNSIKNVENEKIKKEQAYLFGERLHELIIESLNNKLMKETIYSFKFQFTRISLLSKDVPGRTNKAIEEHESLIDAILDNDPDKAEKEMRKHINNAKASIINNV